MLPCIGVLKHCARGAIHHPLSGSAHHQRSSLPIPLASQSISDRMRQRCRGSTPSDEAAGRAGMAERWSRRQVWLASCPAPLEWNRRQPDRGGLPHEFRGGEQRARGSKTIRAAALRAAVIATIRCWSGKRGSPRRAAVRPNPPAGGQARDPRSEVGRRGYESVLAERLAEHLTRRKRFTALGGAHISEAEGWGVLQIRMEYCLPTAGRRAGDRLPEIVGESGEPRGTSVDHSAWDDAIGCGVDHDRDLT
jgi:hypothetical protein